jgi:hypothetical protein
MTTPIDLKQMEQNAFRSTYLDGLWDIYYGLIVICMSFVIFRPASGYSPMNIVLAISSFGISYALFWMCKKFLILPRMGLVTFGPSRRKRKKAMAITLGVIVLIQIIALGIQYFAWKNPSVIIDGPLVEKGVMDLVVATVAALIVGISMVIIAYFRDFPRGFYIAILTSLAVFLMVYFNRPLYAILIGILILLPGLVLFIKFLKKYPMVSGIV